MEKKLSTFNSRLLKWYFEEDKRTFPWRQTTDPYRIVIAEIMLQRTKADQVVPVFLSFMERFPSPCELGRAGLSEIKEYFSKLGLLWRATKVKRLCETLCKDFNGKVPQERDKLKSIPGIGEYVADAVSCFAFGKDTEIIDSNVCRVLGRVFSIKSEGEARRNPTFRKVAQSLIPIGNCREFNWALIDHAHEICKPQNPKCEICPLDRICNYYAARTKYAGEKNAAS
jgi:A/G-specific adenine glycosylase